MEYITLSSYGARKNVFVITLLSLELGLFAEIHLAAENYTKSTMWQLPVHCFIPPPFIYHENYHAASSLLNSAFQRLIRRTLNICLCSPIPDTNPVA